MRPLALILACCAVPGTASALSEGTTDLGLTQGLEGPAAIAVDIRAPGETLRICTSDDGRKEHPVGGLALDAAPVEDGGARAANPVPPGWRGREVVLQRLPVAFAGSRGAQLGLLACRDDDDCEEGEGCLRLEDSRTTCGRSLAVTPAAGYCNAETGPGNWLEVELEHAGIWVVHLAGEPETLNGNNGRSVRYFGVDVLQPDGRSAPGGRIFSPMWMLNAHHFDYATDAEFYALAEVKAQVGGQLEERAHVFVIDFDGMRGFRYQLLANALGIVTDGDLGPDTRLARRSWCLVGDPDPRTSECRSLQPGLEAHFPQLGYRVYLNFPDPAPVRPPEPELTRAEFNDEIGSATITPNGDGVQDSGVFSFTSNVEGTYLVVLDSNGDGTLDPAVDRTLDGVARVGRNEVRWDGSGPDGALLPAGEYRFFVALIAGETHFPMVDIESNSTGFVVWEQPGPNAARVAKTMYWNDLPIRTVDELVDRASDARTTLPSGSSVPSRGRTHQRRVWLQGDGSRMAPEEIYDTWVRGAQASTAAVACRICNVPVQVIGVGGEDERPDVDGDGLDDALEDRNGNGRVDPGETDPHDADSDDDSLPDGVEDANQDGRRDPGETDPTDPDSDDDGLPDGAEDADRDGLRDDGETDPLDADTDGDGLSDGLEVDAANPTSPVDADTDGDGLPDGVEDANRDGVRDRDETDPADRDTDHDGLEDGEELTNDNATDPLDADSDDDLLADGQEDADGDGQVGPDETDPNDPDSDGGGEPDGSEVANGRDPVDDPTDDVQGRRDTDGDGLDDETEAEIGTAPDLADTDGDGLPDGVEVIGANPTLPRDPDTDDDGLPDGVEDANQDGRHDAGETNPADADTDDDGLPDGAEDADRNGRQNGGETDPTVPDTDGDGLLDGIEDADADGRRDAGETDPLDADSDDDTLPDGTEDANGNGRVDEGETDPLNPDTDEGGEEDGSEVAGGRNAANDPEDDLAPDRDGDGLSDVREEALGTNPDDPDTDGDGLSDGDEAAGPTDPNDRDTDDDGLSDGEEVAFGTAPLVPDSDADGLPDGTEVHGDNPTDPRDEDSDDDGLIDGLEDKNGSGHVDGDETDPNVPDAGEGGPGLRPGGDGGDEGEGEGEGEGERPVGPGGDPDGEAEDGGRRLEVTGASPADCSTTSGAHGGGPALALTLLGLLGLRRRAAASR